MSDPQRIRNIDYLGRCYDIVKLDPLDLGNTSKFPNVIDIDASGTEVQTTRDGSWLVPKGVLHNAPFSMSYKSQSSVISSGFELLQDLKQSVGVEAGIEGGFEFSGSASINEAYTETQTRKSSFVFSRAYQENHRVQLDLDDPKAPLRITSAFHDAVVKLPHEEQDDAYAAFLEWYSFYYRNSSGGLGLPTNNWLIGYVFKVKNDGRNA